MSVVAADVIAISSRLQQNRSWTLGLYVGHIPGSSKIAFEDPCSSSLTEVLTPAHLKSIPIPKEAPKA